MTVDVTVPRTRRAVIAGAIGGPQRQLPPRRSGASTRSSRAATATLCWGVRTSRDRHDLIHIPAVSSRGPCSAGAFTTSGTAIHGQSWPMTTSSNLPGNPPVSGSEARRRRAPASSGSPDPWGCGPEGNGYGCQRSQRARHRRGGRHRRGMAKPRRAWATPTAGNTGVQGYSGAPTSPVAPPAPVKTGVYGYAVQDAYAMGVQGKSTVGRGVRSERRRLRGGRLRPRAYMAPRSTHDGLRPADLGRLKVEGVRRGHDRAPRRAP